MDLIRRVEEASRGLDLSPEEIDARGCETVDQAVDALADSFASKTVVHPDYAVLAGRLLVARLHEKTSGSFGRVTRELDVLSPEYARDVEANEAALEAAIDYSLDYGYSYFAFRTLEKSYLLRAKGEIVERPQDMLMRVAVAIHGRDLASVLETYEASSKKLFTHASPVLFNAGTVDGQLSSCFLLSLPSDDAADFYENLKRCGMASKMCGGIGVGVHEVSENLVHLLKLYEDMAKFAKQGKNKRPGAVAAYLEPWHDSVHDFAGARRNVGGGCTPDLFNAMWIPDLFMERVEADADWTLMNPRDCPGLADVYGEEFEKLYRSYESSGGTTKRVKARKVWEAMIASLIETGTPYVMFKDACNRKSNQSHLGTIRNANLCAEIVQYSSADEVAVCNLASVALNAFVTGRRFDFSRFADVVKMVVRNLNRVIDATSYPVPEARASNMKHRPIGVGVQGLADAFALLRLPFYSEEARSLNCNIFEVLYYAAVEASCELAERDGPHESYAGSPTSEGLFQFDLWGVEPFFVDWTRLRERVKMHGLRNSLLVAVMPTASTAQLLGNTESIEPYTYNVYQRVVSSGTFQVVNEHLVRDLMARGLWTESTRNAIVADRGSVQKVAGVPDEIKRLYKTVWEISQRVLIDLSADRAPFVDQSQSLNLYLAEPDYANVSSMLFYAYRKGLKTGVYYLRSQSVVRPLSSVLQKICEECSG